VHTRKRSRRLIRKRTPYACTCLVCGRTHDPRKVINDLVDLEAWLHEEGWRFSPSNFCCACGGLTSAEKAADPRYLEKWWWWRKEWKSRSHSVTWLQGFLRTQYRVNL